MISYSDLFCGVGGFSLALERAVGKENCQCIAAVDIDSAAIDVFNTHFSKIAQCKDIRTFLELRSHDIMFGGFPCQPFSRNNKRYGQHKKTVDLKDSRVNLFEELVRLLKTSLPKYFVFENVKGLTVMKKEGEREPVINEIVQALREAGYRVEYQILNAFDFGVPQQRKRVIFVGIRNDIQQEFSFPLPLIQNPPPCLRDIMEKNVEQKYFLSRLWAKRVLRNSKELKLEQKKDWGIERNHVYESGKLRSEILQKLFDDSTKPTNPTGKLEPVAIYGDTPSGISRQGDRAYHPYGISPTIATFGIPSVPDLRNGQLRQLTPRECARLQGFPDSFDLVYKQIGNAVCVPMIEAVIKNLLAEENMGRPKGSKNKIKSDAKTPFLQNAPVSDVAPNPNKKSGRIVKETFFRPDGSKERIVEYSK